MENIITPRMTMEEKRKIDKIIQSEIERAVSKYGESRRKGQEVLEKAVLKEPSIVKMIEDYKQAKKREEDLEKEMKKIGVRIDYRDEWDVNSANERVKIYERETEKKEEDMRALVREFTLKLYAEGKEAKSLFELLDKKLGAYLK